MEHGNRIGARDRRALEDAVWLFGPAIDRWLKPRASGRPHLATPGAALVVASLPFGLSLGIPRPYLPLTSHVRLRVLSPFHFPRTGPDAAADTVYVDAWNEHVRTTLQVALEALADARRRDRRVRISSCVDRAVTRFERLTLLPRVRTTIAPLPARAAVQRSVSHTTSAR